MPRSKHPGNELIAENIAGCAGVYRELGRRLGVDKNTAKKWVEADSRLKKLWEDEQPLKYDEVLAVLSEDEEGFIRAIARKLGVGRGRVETFLRNNPELGAMLSEKIEDHNDEAEYTVLQIMRGEDEEAKPADRLNAATKYLAAKAKARGWGGGSSVDIGLGEGAGPIAININLPNGSDKEAAGGD